MPELEMVDLLGRPLLAYLLGVEADELDSALESPTDKQQVTIGVLQATLVQLPTTALERRFQLEEWLGRNIDGAHTVANVLRLQSGADLPSQAASKDPVVDAYRPLVDACYPLLLLPDTDDWPLIGVSLAATTFHSPRRAAVETAIWQDPVLSLLFPQTGDAMSSTVFTTRAHSGGSIQLSVLLQQTISLAWQECRLASPDPTPQHILDRIARNLSVLRRAVQGKAAKTTAIVGLTGVLLPDGLDEIDLTFARIRRVSDEHRRLIRHTGVQGKLRSTNEHGDVLEIDYSGDLIAEIDVPYKIHLGERPIEDEWPAELIAISRMVIETVETIRAGLVLALNEPEPVNIAVAWQLLLDPLANAVSPGWSDTRTLPNLTPRKLTQENCHEWQVLAVAVHAHRRHVAIALRRLLQAVGSRHSLDDTLLDAIIVWENLFGASTETTLRVCASMAWLLGSDASDRRARLKEYKKLYQTRSDLVHGNVRTEKLEPGELFAQARHAVQVSLSALRTLFVERTDLLAIAKSEDRSVAVLLDDAPIADAPEC